MLCIKLRLSRKAEVETRRFSVDRTVTFPELMSMAQHLWGGTSRALCFEYRDDQDDVVRMTTDLEWAECKRLYAATAATTPLLLTVSRMKVASKEQRGARAREDKDDASDQEPECLAVDRAIAAPAAATSAAAATKTVSSEEPSTPTVPKLALPEAPAAEPVRNGGSARRGPSSARLPGDTTHQRRVLDLMSELFHCDAEAVLSGCCDLSALGPLAAVTKRSVDPTTHSVFVDICTVALRHQAVVEGNRRMLRADLSGAERVLRLAQAVYANDQILEYNMACALALQARPEEALAMLQAAVEHGYSDVDHMLRDADLVSLRALDAFVNLARRMREAREPAVAPAVVAPTPAAEPAAPTPAAPEVTPAAAPVPPASSTAPRGFSDKVLMLRAIFPQMTVEQAAMLLQFCGGDVQRAVDSALV